MLFGHRLLARLIKGQFEYNTHILVLLQCADFSIKVFTSGMYSDRPVLTLCLLGHLKYPFIICFFFKSTFLKNAFWNTIRVSNSLYPDQARRYVGPDLGPKCLQMLSADDTRR